MESVLASTLALSAIARSGNLVRVAPGSRTTTWIPNGLASTRNESLRASNANLEAQYAPRRGGEMRPARELTLTMHPLRWRRIAGRTARQTDIAPKTFTSNCRRRASLSRSSTAPKIANPALFTTTSIRPAASSTRWTPRRTEFSSATSISMTSRDGERPRRCSTFSSVRPDAKTRYPSPARVVAVASPIPLELPVMSATGCVPAVMEVTGTISYMHLSSRYPRETEAIALELGTTVLEPLDDERIDEVLGDRLRLASERLFRESRVAGEFGGTD